MKSVKRVSALCFLFKNTYFKWILDNAVKLLNGCFGTVYYSYSYIAILECIVSSP